MREVLRETEIYRNNKYIRKKNMIQLMRKKKRHQHKSRKLQNKMKGRDLNKQKESMSLDQEGYPKHLIDWSM